MRGNVQYAKCDLGDIVVRLSNTVPFLASVRMEGNSVNPTIPDPCASQNLFTLLSSFLLVRIIIFISVYLLLIDALCLVATSIIEIFGLQIL